MNLTDITIGQDLVADDHCGGNYCNESVTVLGFTMNRYGKDLVRVRVNNEYGNQSVFYPSELSDVHAYVPTPDSVANNHRF